MPSGSATSQGEPRAAWRCPHRHARGRNQGNAGTGYREGRGLLAAPQLALRAARGLRPCSCPAATAVASGSNPLGPRSTTLPSRKEKRAQRARFYLHGGEGGIRTHDTRKGIPDFESGRFNRSRTSPNRMLSPRLGTRILGKAAAYCQPNSRQSSECLHPG